MIPEEELNLQSRNILDEFALPTEPAVEATKEDPLYVVHYVPQDTPKSSTGEGLSFSKGNPDVLNQILSASKKSPHGTPQFVVFAPMPDNGDLNVLEESRKQLDYPDYTDVPQPRNTPSQVRVKKVKKVLKEVDSAEDIDTSNSNPKSEEYGVSSQFYHQGTPEIPKSQYPKYGNRNNQGNVKETPIWSKKQNAYEASPNVQNRPEFSQQQYSQHNAQDMRMTTPAMNFDNFSPPAGFLDSSSFRRPSQEIFHRHSSSNMGDVASQGYGSTIFSDNAVQQSKREMQRQPSNDFSDMIRYNPQSGNGGFMGKDADRVGSFAPQGITISLGNGLPLGPLGLVRQLLRPLSPFLDLKKKLFFGVQLENGFGFGQEDQKTGKPNPPLRGVNYSSVKSF